MSNSTKPDLSRIQHHTPSSLRDRPQWVAWRTIERSGKLTKAPVNPRTGELARSNDRSTWGTFEQALNACRTKSDLSGIGFVFSPDDPYCGVDLDDCIDPTTGVIKPWARDFIEQLASYSEISPSGTGVKLFLKGRKPGARCRSRFADGEVEIYDHDRFFVVTGRCLDSAPTDVELRQEQLDAVYHAVFGHDDDGLQGQHALLDPDDPLPFMAGQPALGDDEIIDLASQQRRSGSKFASLWAGDWNSHFNSASEADSSVVFTLAFYTKDAAQIDRLFRRSGLMRPKWDERHGETTYGALTIGKALGKVTQQYTPSTNHRSASPRPPPKDLGLPNATIDWEFKSDQTENAMAVEFIDANQAKLRYVPSWKKWLVWDEKRWKVDVDSSRATRLARRLVRNYWDRLQDIQPEKQQKDWADFCRWANRKTTIENVVSLARCDARTTIDHEQLNQNIYHLNLQNGTLDLSTGEFHDHRPTDSITQIANVAFDPQAQCPRWRAFIDIIFGDDDQAKRYVQALLGYSCSGDVGEHVLPICYGSGANGKSTLWNAIIGLLGDYAMLAPSKLLLGTTNEHDTVIASLYQRRLVAISEPDEGARLREARVKELTGDEQVTARRMREDYWSFRRTHKFWLSTNHLPQINGTDEGIWRRIKLIPFRVDVRKVTEPIPDYHKLLVREEGPGILNWLLAGFNDWRAHGFIEPQSVIDETQSYRGSSDELGRFISDCCKVSPELVVASSELFEAYRNWGGQQSQTRFSTSTQSRFNCVTRTSGRYRNKRVFEGVALSEIDENA